MNGSCWSSAWAIPKLSPNCSAATATPSTVSFPAASKIQLALKNSRKKLLSLFFAGSNRTSLAGRFALISTAEPSRYGLPSAAHERASSHRPQCAESGALAQELGALASTFVACRLEPSSHLESTAMLGVEALRAGELRGGCKCDRESVAPFWPA